MKIATVKTLFVAAALSVLALGSAPVLAQDDDGGDLEEATIRLMGQAEAELPEAVTREIVLPENVKVDAAAVEQSADGLATANEARQRREQGLDIAADARNNAAADALDNASDMADAALENAENRSRADENRPDMPEVPDTPAPPTTGQ